MGYPIKLTSRISVLGNRHISTYLVRGDDSSVLIEPGISSTAQRLIDQIKALNIDPFSITGLLLTHAHADHITGAPVLKRAIPGITVSGSSDTERLLGKPKVREIFLSDDADISMRLNSMGEGGRPEDVSDRLSGLIDETLHAGLTIDLGGIALHVIDAPGHCWGGVAFWEPDERVLFCSDYLGFFLAPNRFVPNFYVNLIDYMATFQSLAALDPRWICPGHGDTYGGKEATAFIDQSLNEIKWIYHRVLAMEKQPHYEEGALIGELFNRYYLREAKMFSEQSTTYCMKLLVRRILDAKDRVDIFERREI